MSFNRLIDKAKEETNNFNIETTKSDENIPTFKTLNNSEEEIKKFIICNLFFFIKPIFENEFKYQIHNKSNSINLLTIEILKNFEYKNEKNIEDKEKIKNQNKKEISGIQTNSKPEENKKEIITVNINKTCPNNYRKIKKLYSEIKVKEQKIPPAFIYNYTLYLDESIINSNLNEFIKMLQEMKSFYSLSFNISVFDSLNLYLNGKKIKIMEKEASSVTLKKIITEYSEKISEDNKLNEIINFCENFENSFKIR